MASTGSTAIFLPARVRLTHTPSDGLEQVNSCCWVSVVSAKKGGIMGYGLPLLLLSSQVLGTPSSMAYHFRVFPRWVSSMKSSIFGII